MQETLNDLFKRIDLNQLLLARGFKKDEPAPWEIESDFFIWEKDNRRKLYTLKISKSIVAAIREIEGRFLEREDGKTSSSLDERDFFCSEFLVPF